MPIDVTDVLLKYSDSTATAGDAHTGSVATSLGKFISTTVIVDATVGNIFPDMTGAENAAENVDFVCIFIHNNHPTLTLQNARVWVSADVAGGATAAIAVDPTATSDIGSTSDQAVTIADKNTAPAGVGPFTEPMDPASALPLGDLGPGQCHAFWVRRVATNSGAMDADGATFRIDGDTSE
jgi:hypothetical protein